MTDDLVKRLRARADMHVAATPATMLRKAAARIRELEAEVEKLRGDLTSARDYAVQAENERDDAKAEIAHLTATVEAYEDMKAQMDADGGPGVLRRQMELRNYKVRAEKAEAERDEAINQLDSCRHTNDVWERRAADLKAERDDAKAALRALSETEGE